ncbi:MAG: LacI family DNA-binding transcriptional regulator, partial [Halanaerobiales bacterium]
AIARSLSTNKSNSIGVFMHYHPSRGLHHIFFHEILFGLETNLGKKGYDFVYFSDLKWKRSCDYLAKCLNRHIDGVILMGVNVDENTDELLKSDIPTVFLDLDLKGINATYITSDNKRGAGEAVNYLYQLGHKNIGMIAGATNTMTTRDRTEGFNERIQELDLFCREEWKKNTVYSEDGGYNAMKELLKQKELPTAFFCHSDMIAIGAMKAIKEAGYTVPDDFSIIGFDDIEICTYVTPLLTTIRQDRYLMGDKTGDILLEMINNPEEDVSPVILPVELIPRDSCRKLS